MAAPDSDTFINPDWANTAWYAGAALGQSRATIDDSESAAAWPPTAPP